MNFNKLMNLRPGLGGPAALWVLALTLMVVVAACGGAAEDPTQTSGAIETPDSAPTAVAPSTAQATETAPATSIPGGMAGAARVEANDAGELGDILVDSEGMTLYIFRRDTEGVSNCSGGCLTIYPPLLTEGAPVAGDGVTAELGTIARDNGTTQVTVNGFPAYYFQSDTAPGDTTGHGNNGLWSAFGPDGVPKA